MEINRKTHSQIDLPLSFNVLRDITNIQPKTEALPIWDSVIL